MKKDSKRIRKLLKSQQQKTGAPAAVLSTNASTLIKNSELEIIIQSAIKTMFFDEDGNVEKDSVLALDKLQMEIDKYQVKKSAIATNLKSLLSTILFFTVCVIIISAIGLIIVAIIQKSLMLFSLFIYFILLLVAVVALFMGVKALNKVDTYNMLIFALTIASLTLSGISIYLTLK